MEPLRLRTVSGGGVGNIDKVRSEDVRLNTRLRGEASDPSSDDRDDLAEAIGLEEPIDRGDIDEIGEGVERVIQDVLGETIEVGDIGRSGIGDVEDLGEMELPPVK